MYLIQSTVLKKRTLTAIIITSILFGHFKNSKGNLEAFEKMKSFLKSLVFSQKRPQVIKTCREIPRINPYNL